MTTAPWSAAPVLDWLLHKGRLVRAPEALIGELCARLCAAGMPLGRMGTYVFSLHPVYAGVRYIWDGAEVLVQHGTHEFMTTPPFLESPMHRIMEGERVIRRKLCDEHCANDYAVVDQLREEGFTDYVISELVFGDGSRNSVSLSTLQAGGFTQHDINQAESLLHIFALLMDNYTNRSLSSTLLKTYIGNVSGERVLAGRIKRGDGDLIDAIIWFSDLRDSTPLSETLGTAAFLGLLNEYFDATAGVVVDHGGEVLRFIGDASLAVFPIERDRAGFEHAARTAVTAAYDAMHAVDELNAKRESEGKTPIRCGIGLHRGEVLYGNIGTPSRLEFTVIGAAANEAARIEGLCKTQNQRLVVTDQIADTVKANWTGLGVQSLQGVKRQRALFGLAAIE